MPMFTEFRNRMAYIPEVPITYQGKEDAEIASSARPTIRPRSTQTPIERCHCGFAFRHLLHRWPDATDTGLQILNRGVYNTV